MSTLDVAYSPPVPRPGRPGRAAAIFGPGFLVMLADTDAGSLVTAAQSGASRGYSLLLLQLVLIPVLFVVQELALRLGLVTGLGQGALLRRHLGPAAAWTCAVALALVCCGALVTELAGLAGIGALFGVPAPLTACAAAATLFLMFLTGSYRRVERIAILLGLFELAFVFVAWRAEPDGAELARGLATLPVHDGGWLYLVAANLGAVVMPWMVFYQQSAVARKGLGPADLPAARRETALGAVVTQVIAGSVLVAAAATLGRSGGAAPLETVQQISEALTPFLGPATGRLVFALGMSGAALVATVVVALTAAWGLGEAAGLPRPAGDDGREAPWFYVALGIALALAAAIVAGGADLVALSVAVQVLNALLLPLVLGFLFLMASRALPPPYRLAGPYRALVAAVFVLTSGFAVATSVAGLVG